VQRRWQCGDGSGSATAAQRDGSSGAATAEAAVSAETALVADDDDNEVDGNGVTGDDDGYVR